MSRSVTSSLTLPNGRGSAWSTPTPGFCRLAGTYTNPSLPRRSPGCPGGGDARAVMLYNWVMRLRAWPALAALATGFACGWPAQAQSTVVGIRGSQFTINGHPTYTAEAGFPKADANLAGTLLNVRAVQAIFDDANYPRQGSRANPYSSNTMGAVAFDYPDGKWDAERQTAEFVKALPDWRRCGLLAFTVNLQGGGPTDGNYGENGPMPQI